MVAAKISSKFEAPMGYLHIDEKISCFESFKPEPENILALPLIPIFAWV